MNKSLINKLLLCRSLYFQAQENIKSSNGVRISIACNLLQDSVESFLLGLCEKLDINVPEKAAFSKYIELINEKISPLELPFRQNLNSLNKLRVNSKHHGLEPAKNELEPLFLIVWEFFNQASQSHFGKSFSAISLVELLRDSEYKDLLSSAEQCFNAKDFRGCLENVRKAIYVKFECAYDAKQFLEDKQLNGLMSLTSKVPYFARNKKYLEENVKEPTDYIIYDHNALEMELMKLNIDSVAYWNVWRLTPEVYRNDKNSSWIVKNDLSKFDEEGILERAEYVLHATTEMLLCADQSYIKSKSPNRKYFYIELIKESVPIYEKASKSSKVRGFTPPGVVKIDSNYSIEGIDNSGLFWHVSHWDDDLSIYGYIHNDCLKCT